MAFIPTILADVKGIVPARSVQGMELTEEGELRELARLASEDFNGGRYEEALKKYQEIYRRGQKPKSLFNIGQCWRSLGKTKEALTSFRLYLAEIPDAPNRKEIEELIVELEASQDIFIPGPISPQMVRLYTEAKGDYQAGRYQAALKKFEDVAGLEGVSWVQYDIALCFEKLGKKEEAIAAYQLYLEEVQLKEAERRAVEARITQLRKPAKEPARAEAPAPPVKLKPAKLPPPAETAVSLEVETPPKTSRKKVAGYTLAVAGGLALGGSVWSYLQALKYNKRHASRINELVEEGEIRGEPGDYQFATEAAKQQFKPELDGIEGEMDINQIRAISLLAGGLIFVGGSITFFVFDRKRNAKVSADVSGTSEARLKLQYQF